MSFMLCVASKAWAFVGRLLVRRSLPTVASTASILPSLEVRKIVGKVAKQFSDSRVWMDAHATPKKASTYRCCVLKDSGRMYRCSVYTGAALQCWSRRGRETGGKSQHASILSGAGTFDFNSAEGIFESVRADKALGAGTQALVVSPATGHPCKCRHAEHEPATARLKIPFPQSGVSHVAPRLLRTTNDARWRKRETDAVAGVFYSRWNLASFLSKHDFVTLRGFAPRTPESKAGKRDRRKRRRCA